jgi:hypothetical protein
MQPFYITIGEDIPLMIMPDSDAHADGHAVLTYTYSIYKDSKGEGVKMRTRESNMHLSKNDDPDYLGYITFEQPGRMFTYTSDGSEELSSDEVEEIIELITHYRDRPSEWII